MQLAFIETSDRSWFRDGKLTLSHPELLALQMFADDRVSDLSLLLETFVSLRRARSVDIRLPPLSEADHSCLELAEWLREDAVKPPYERGWFDDDSLYSWDYVEHLEHCELRLHLLLSTLESSIAPFLRLEQLASLTQFTCYRLAVFTEKNASFDGLENNMYATLNDMFSYAVALCPYGFGDCGCDDWNKSRGLHNCGEKWMCRGSWDARRWLLLMKQRDIEIRLQRDQVKKGIFANDSKMVNIGDLTAAEDNAHNACGCFCTDSKWIEHYPRGLVPYWVLLGRRSVQTRLQDRDVEVATAFDLVHRLEMQEHFARLARRRYMEPGLRVNGSAYL